MTESSSASSSPSIVLSSLLDLPNRIPAPLNPEHKKKLKIHGFKLIDPIVIKGVTLYKLIPRHALISSTHEAVRRKETDGSIMWFVLNDSTIAIMSIKQFVDGSLLTRVYDPVPQEARDTQLLQGAQDNPDAPVHMAIFAAKFSCILRGFFRQDRRMERERFADMLRVYNIVREWALTIDEKYPDRTENMGSMIMDVEERMKISRNILDTPIGKEPEGNDIINNCIVIKWILTSGSNERGIFFRSVYQNCLKIIESTDPEFAKELGIAYAKDQSR